MLERMGGRLGENHAGNLRRESAEDKAQRIIKEHLQRLGWQESERLSQPKSAPGKLPLAARLQRETALSLKWITARVHLDSSKSANAKLHHWLRTRAEPTPAASQPGQPCNPVPRI